MSEGSPDKVWTRLTSDAVSADRMDELIGLIREPQGMKREKPSRLFEIFQHLWSGDGGLAQQAVIVSELGRVSKSGIEMFEYGIGYFDDFKRGLFSGADSNFLSSSIAIEVDILGEKQRTALLSATTKDGLGQRRYNLQKTWQAVSEKRSLRSKRREVHISEEHKDQVEMLDRKEVKLLLQFHLLKLKTMYWFADQLMYEGGRMVKVKPQVVRDYLPKKLVGVPEAKEWWNRTVGQYLPQLEVKTDEEIPNLGQIMDVTKEVINSFSKT